MLLLPHRKIRPTKWELHLITRRAKILFSLPMIVCFLLLGVISGEFRLNCFDPTTSKFLAKGRWVKQTKTHRSNKMTKAKNQTKVLTEKREYQSNVIQFSSVKKTKNGFAIFLGKNVIFLNQGLLDYINKKKAS